METDKQKTWGVSDNATPEEIITTYLQFVRMLHDISNEAYVLKHGKFFTPQDLPVGIIRGKPRECFMNATHLVWENSQLTYVEGFAISDIINLPMHHAWCIDKNGNVIDPTWNTKGKAYFGFEIPTHKLMEIMMITKEFGVMGDFSMKWRNILEPQKEKE